MTRLAEYGAGVSRSRSRRGGGRTRESQCLTGHTRIGRVLKFLYDIATFSLTISIKTTDTTAGNPAGRISTHARPPPTIYPPVPSLTHPLPWPGKCHPPTYPLTNSPTHRRGTYPIHPQTHPPTMYSTTSVKQSVPAYRHVPHRTTHHYHRYWYKNCVVFLSVRTIHGMITLKLPHDYETKSTSGLQTPYVVRPPTQPSIHLASHSTPNPLLTHLHTHQPTHARSHSPQP